MQERILHQAYYFCKDDNLSEATIKFGTFEEARRTCTKIYTPKICHNETNLLEDLIMKAEDLNPGKCFQLFF